MPLFTVFTPTFNRAATLHRVYESLAAQTCRDFEWVIVDDGSTDGTAEVVAAWTREADFPITYVWQENQGKHVAFNRGVALASGELFLPLDSDDGCVPTALERFDHHWRAISDDPQFSAVTALCADPAGRLVGTRFPADPTDSDSLELRYRHKVRGEKWGFHRVSVLREHPFPEIPGCQFIPEGVVWSKIARRYKTRYVNEPLRVYHPGADQLTAAAAERHAGALALWHRETLNNELDWFGTAPLQFLRAAAHYGRFSMHRGEDILAQWRGLQRPPARALWLFALPLAGLLFFLDCRKTPESASFPGGAAALSSQ